MASPRVALVSRSYYPDDPRLARQASALVEDGFRVDVVCLRRPLTPEPGRDVVDGVAVQRLGGTRRRGSKARYFLEYGTFLWSAAAILAREHARDPFSLVQAANPPDALVACGFPARFTGAALVLDIHDLSPELYASKFARGGEWPVGASVLRVIERLATASAHHVIVAGSLFRARLIERGLPPARVTSIPNGPDERLFDPRLRGPTEPGSLVYHGSLFDRYGFSLALDAFPVVLARFGSARLDVWGDGPELEPLRERARHERLDGAVSFHGAVSLRAIPGLIANAACGLSTLRSDRFTELAFPTKVAEYAQLGVPVAASRTRALTEVFPEDALGFYRPGDAASLSETIVSLLEEPRRAEQQAARARAAVVPLLWSRHRERYVELVRGLIEARRGQ